MRFCWRWFFLSVQPVVLVLFSPLIFLLNSCSSHVVGWPPIRSYRMNSLVNQAKLPATEEFNSLIGSSKNSNTVVGKGTNNCSDKNNGSAKENGRLRSSLFVKVNMDGTPIGRKVDLSAHRCYETLAQTLEDMFHTSTSTISSIRECFLYHLF